MTQKVYFEKCPQKNRTAKLHYHATQPYFHRKKNDNFATLKHLITAVGHIKGAEMTDINFKVLVVKKKRRQQIP